MKKAKPNWAWRDFWKADRAASCVPRNRETENEIYAHWRVFFAGLPDDSRVLDVATGNGILLYQAVQAAPEKRFVLTGIDLADIDPYRYVSGFQQSRSDIRFMGEIDAVSLPFDARSFDVVVSQYGLEYSDLNRALDEVERVLSPNGDFCWLAHCDESEVVMQNRDQSDQVNFLLGPDGPVAAMERLISRIKRKKSPKWSMTKLDHCMRSAEEYCRTRPSADIVQEVCSGLADVANRWQAYLPADLEKMIVRTRQELASHRQRITELRMAVLDEKKVRMLRERLATSNWKEAAVSTFCAGSAAGPIGLMIRARRSEQ